MKYFLKLGLYTRNFRFFLVEMLTRCRRGLPTKFSVIITNGFFYILESDFARFSHATHQKQNYDFGEKKSSELCGKKTKTHRYHEVLFFHQVEIFLDNSLRWYRCERKSGQTLNNEFSVDE